MTVRLIALTCPACEAPLRPSVDVAVFSCVCGAILELGAEGPVVRPVRKTALDGRPWWCVLSRVRFTRRETADGPADADPLWAEPARIWVPAFEASLDRAVELAVGATRRGVRLEEIPGDLPPETLDGCVISAVVASALTELVVLSIEAERGDVLADLAFELQADPPELWVLSRYVC